jgi:hypothetical protein
VAPAALRTARFAGLREVLVPLVFFAAFANSSSFAGACPASGRGRSHWPAPPDAL